MRLTDIGNSNTVYTMFKSTCYVTFEEKAVVDL